MDSDILRADQIDFINRNEKFEPEVDSLSNNSVRPTQNYEKLYRSSVVSKQPMFKNVYNYEK